MLGPKLGNDLHIQNLGYMYATWEDLGGGTGGICENDDHEWRSSLKQALLVSKARRSHTHGNAWAATCSANLD
jgi:hypothetical protein